jgi:hypothetical protein
MQQRTKSGAAAPRGSQRVTARGLFFAGVVALAATLTAPTPATADLIWDFNDFPTAQEGFAVGDAIYPTDYACLGKTYCTGTDLLFFGTGGNYGAISKVIDGVTGTFSRPYWEGPGVHSGYNAMSVGSALNWGNTSPGDAHPYLADFSTGFTSAAVDLAGPTTDMAGAYDLGAPFGAYGAFVDMWSGPGGTGELLARAEVLPGDAYSGTLSLDAPAGMTARSLAFGRFLVGSPGCVYEPYSSGLSFPCLYATQANADNIRITAVPEAVPTLLLGMGLAALGTIRRPRGTAS